MGARYIDIPLILSVSIPTRSKGMELGAADAKKLVQIGPLFNWDSTEARTKISVIVDAVLNRLCNVIFLNPTSNLLLLAKYQEIAASFSFCSTFIRNIYDEQPP